MEADGIVTLSPLETAVDLKDQIDIPGGAKLDDKQLVGLVGHQLVRHEAVLSGLGGSDVELSSTL